MARVHRYVRPPVCVSFASSGRPPSTHGFIGASSSPPLPNHNPQPNHTPAGLASSIPKFKELGITTPEKLAAFSLPDYDLVGVDDTNDRKKLFFLVQRLKVAVEEKAHTKKKFSTPQLQRSSSSSSSNDATDEELSRSQRAQVMSVDLSAVTLHSGPGGMHTKTPSNGGEAGGGTTKALRPTTTGWWRRGSSMESSTSSLPPHSVPPPPPAYYLPSPSVSSSSASAAASPAPTPTSLPAPTSRQAETIIATKPQPPPKDEAMPPPPPKQQQQHHQHRRTLSNSLTASIASHKSSPFNHPAQGLVDLISEGPEDDVAIRVVVRKRPLTQGEKKRGDVDIVDSQPPCNVVVNEPKKQLDLTPITESHYFAFDYSFDHLSANAHMYQTVCVPLVVSMFRGGNSTCFAYGQTGSGKTFTMMGSTATGVNERAQAGGTVGGSSRSNENAGLYELAAQDIFQVMDHPRFQPQQWSLHVSFFEIYNGKLYDLLNGRHEIKCLEDAKQRVHFKNLKETHVHNVEELFGVMDEGRKQRSTGSTAANQDSSRSHAILQLSLKAPLTGAGGPSAASNSARDLASKGKRNVRVIKESNTAGAKQPVVGTFSFIDLAGSERGADTANTDKNTGKEGRDINTSLLALKEVIRALDRKQLHTPFRQSKLTQVLKDSLVGANAKTIMVACIAPTLSSCENTLNTLRYADRVKEHEASPSTPTTTTTPATACMATTSASAGAVMTSTLSATMGSTSKELRTTLGSTTTSSSNSSSNTKTLSSSMRGASAPNLGSSQQFSSSSTPLKSGTGGGGGGSSRHLNTPTSSSSSSTPATKHQHQTSPAADAEEMQRYVAHMRGLRRATSLGRQRQPQIPQEENAEEEEEEEEGEEDAEALYQEAAHGLIETHRDAHVQLLAHLREEVDLLHVTDEDRENLEAYLDSMEKLLEDQELELERIGAQLEHVKTAKAKLSATSSSALL